MSGREGVLNVTIATSECFFFSFFFMYTLVLSSANCLQILAAGLVTITESLYVVAHLYLLFGVLD